MKRKKSYNILIRFQNYIHVELGWFRGALAFWTLAQQLFIGSQQGALISVYRSRPEMGVNPPSQKKFLAIQLGVPGEVSEYTDWLLPTIRTFLDLCFPELWGREHEISRGEIVRGGPQNPHILVYWTRFDVYFFFIATSVTKIFS